MLYNFITIEGNIGAGKTTLAQLLSQHYNARLILEEFADNPFLPKFYEKPEQYAFPVELFFMAERFKQLKELLQQQNPFLITYSRNVSFLPRSPCRKTSTDFINVCLTLSISSWCNPIC
jgi:deoxyadenosine/deoxycytidine kinase